MENITLAETFKATSIRLGGEKFQISKGSVKVKSGRSDQSSGHIDIPVHIIKSSDPNPREPVFWLAGGPGISNLKQKPSRKLLSHHDFVLVGYRGVDGSVRLNSRKLKKAVKGINNSLLSDQSLVNLGNSIEEYIRDISANSINPEHFTITDVIDDFEEIRELLGYNRINLLSASYGTRVALLYSYRYPQSIKRSVMLGVNPPGHFVWWPEKTEEIIQAYDSIYRSVAGNGGISIEESIHKALADMPERWAFFKLDADKIRATSFVMLYRKQGAAMVFDAFKKAALKNDYSGLYLMQLAYDYLVPRMFAWGDFFNKGACADFKDGIDYSSLLKTEKTNIGAPLSELIWGGVRNWPPVIIGTDYRKVKYSETETLMIGGNLDISTPPEYATQELLPLMPNARQVILKHMAHVDDLMYLQKRAFDHLVAGYFENGTADTDLFTEDPVVFRVPVSFNGLAKGLFPVVIILNLVNAF